MKTSTIVTWIVVIVIIILGGWYLMSSHGTPTVAPAADNTTPATTTAPVATAPAPEANQTNTPPATSAPMIPAPSTLVLKVSTSATLGNYLTASSNGMTLYTSSKDTANVSNCTGSCASNWPPYTTTGKAPFTAVGNVSGKISSITRADGTTQLAYNGMPLYFWSQDQNPGDTTGENIGGFVVAKP